MKLETPKITLTPAALLTNIFVKTIIPIIGIIAVGAIVYGGVLLVTSQGEPDKITKAKSVLTWAIVGVLIVVLATAIVTWGAKFFTGLAS